ncbi:MAG TPA: porin family protein [Burkholderiales bacterium]|nr:porin family protein [Burkholderiales bacterium]
MKAIKFLLPGAIAGAISLAAPALAQDSTASTIASHIYVGANAGQGHWRSICANSASCDDTASTLGVFAGYQINRIFSVEGAFRNYGESKSPSATIKGKGWEASGLAAWPIVGSLSVYGRLGMYRGVLKGDGTLTGTKESTNGPTYGAGLQIEVSKNVALRGEWQGYSGLGGSTLPKGDLNVVTVGALWQFR